MTSRTRVYLDTSVYNRPFDDQNQTRVRLETEAFLLILEKAISKSISIVGSSVLAYENSQSPFFERKERVSSYLSVASKSIRLTEVIKQRAQTVENAGIDSIDALHIACAESSADFFVTCDDSIIKRVKRKPEMFKIEVCNPLELVLKEVFRGA
ncbi:MAG TPA: PIN domain-containing protein [Dissulfurispiraceae bacterium]|nr:PIN domain-containing protein [Dissulfurispiraceae bacterium]